MARGVIHVFIEAANASIVVKIVWLVSLKISQVTKPLYGRGLPVEVKCI